MQNALAWPGCPSFYVISTCRNKILKNPSLRDWVCFSVCLENRGQNDEPRNVDRRWKHKSWESYFAVKLTGKTKTLTTVDYAIETHFENLSSCNKIYVDRTLFGSDCQNTSKSLEGWNHTPYYSMHLALSVSSPSHRIKIEERWHITSEFSCLELVPRIGRFEWSQWSDMVPLLWINPLIRSLAHERHWFSGLWEYLHWLFSSWLLLQKIP